MYIYKFLKFFYLKFKWRIRKYFFAIRDKEKIEIKNRRLKAGNHHKKENAKTRYYEAQQANRIFPPKSFVRSILKGLFENKPPRTK